MAHADSSLPPVILGVSGGIAAYKAAYVVSLLRESCDIYVVMTANATKLVGPATFANLTGHPVLTDLWDGSEHGNPVHIDIQDVARALLIAPATANIIGKIAHGIADDALSTVALSVTCPAILAPAMNTKMYANPIVADNVEKLRRFGYKIIEPGQGWLACGHHGPGRLAPEEQIAEAVKQALEPQPQPRHLRDS